MNPFSDVADSYSRFRPTYPPELYTFLLRYVPEKTCAWDCGTGNGQVAFELANHFEQVKATDISQKQIEQATAQNKIQYSVQPAEKTSFPGRSFDLITAGQAAHWFNLDLFYREVKRTARKGAVIALFGYGLIQINPEIDELIHHFYRTVVGDFWDTRRIHIEEHYRTLPFPFPEMETPHLTCKTTWSMDHLKKYLETWSAVTLYKKRHGGNPLDQIGNKLLKAWNEGPKGIAFPIFIRAGVAANV